MKNQVMKVEEQGLEKLEPIITAQASVVTNGTGGGSIIEGTYTVWRCPFGMANVPVCPNIF